jgi:dipeptidyl aminopeptidase/acylaminoacyl peptidase
MKVLSAKKQRALFALLLVLALATIYLASQPGPTRDTILSPLAKKQVKKQPDCQPRLAQYSFTKLAQRKYSGSQISLERIIKKEKGYVSWLFSYSSDGKRVTGMANIPKRQGKLPVVIMLRGYADKEIYFTGLGTRKAAGVFAENGFITLAPDFLGFGGSNSESSDILEARFTRPITVLNLIASVKSLPQADPGQIFLWGHSNGGQIALSVLEISQKIYPTTLWAPVTKSFPQSILQYIDPQNISPASQKVIKRIEQFEKCYKPELYSVTNFINQIKAPLQIHQGGKDRWVLAKDQENFVEKLKLANQNISYYFYPNADHNLKPNWDTVVQRNLKFFKKYLR